MDLGRKVAREGAQAVEVANEGVAAAAVAGSTVHLHYHLAYLHACKRYTMVCRVHLISPLSYLITV